MFNRMNLSIYRPKKDQCDICVGYETKDISRKIIYDISNVKIQPEVKKRKTMVFVRALENEKVLMITMDVMC